MTREQELRFIGASITDKQIIINSNSTTPAMAEEYLSLCGVLDCNDIVNSGVENKIGKNCGEECKAIREKAERDLNKTAAAIDKIYDQNINKTSAAVVNFQKASLGLKELGKFAQKLRQEAYSSATQLEMLKTKITKAKDDGVFNEEMATLMKEKVSGVMGMSDTGSSTFAEDSLKNVIDSVDKVIREKQDENIKDWNLYTNGKEISKNYVKKAGRELRGMSATDGLTKAADGIAGLASGVGKIMDASGDGLKVVGGVLDIMSAASVLLPPPASLVTSTFSGIFNLFAGGPPDATNQQVIDELKNDIKRGFAHQKNFLEKKFAEHANLIREEFQKLENKIKDQLEQLGKTVKKYMDEDHLRKVKNDALAQMEAVEEKLVFIKQYNNAKVTDNVAQSIAREISALSSTRYSALSKTTFEDICPGILDDKYAESKTVRRKFCATLLYTYLIVEQDRNIVLMQLIAVLQNTPLRKSNEGYLEVYYHRKNEMEEFVTRTVLKDNVGCSLFNPQAGTPVLTHQQITEISNYIETLSKSFHGSINAFRKKNDCPRKYLQT